MNSTPDGQFQTYATESGAYIREHFFGGDQRLRAMVENMTDYQIQHLGRGGHDHKKVYAAYAAAKAHKGQPTVILAQTVKGWTLGPNFEGRNATHQMKKLTVDDLKRFRDRLHIPITDAQLESGAPPYYHPGPKSPEIQYMHDQRSALGGYVPTRVVRAKPLELPGDATYAAAKKGSGQQSIATTMAFVRILKDLMRDKEIGKRFVLIAPDEYRTFGMDAFFPSAKIYNPLGQQYEAVDRDLLLAYKESPTGQMLHDGISEAGCTASLIAAGSAYATHGEPLIPVYVFYSMFGFQRTGDQFWQMADQLARGFVLGATAGRTTLTGEGLQHADGHSQLLASTNPGCVAYDPAYGYEIAHIVEDGLRRMYGPESEDVFYYLTVYNEPIQHPAEPHGRRRGRDPEGPPPGVAGHGGHHRGAAHGLGRGGAVGAGGAADPGRRLERAGGRLVGDLLERAAPRCRRGGGAQPAPPGGGAARPVRDAEAVGCGRSVRGGLRLDAVGPGPDLAVGARPVHLAGRGRLRLRRHPRRGPALLPHRRAVGGPGHAHRARQGGPDRPFGAEAGRRPLPAAGRRGGRPGRGGRRRVAVTLPWGRWDICPSAPYAFFTMLA